MNTIALNSVAVLVVASVSVCAWADGRVRVRPLPANVRSVDSPGITAAAQFTDTAVRTAHGAMRVRADASSEHERAERPNVNAPRAVLVNGPDGQLMRVVPGTQPDQRASASAAVPALPEGARVVELGHAKILQMPNAVDSTQGLAEATPVPAGMRIVDLPPGAVAPAGMPEPMTLYRVTAGPRAATE
jgi:hypothetical protein